MDGEIEQYVVAVRADTQGFARDVAAMRGELEGPLAAGVGRDNPLKSSHNLAVDSDARHCRIPAVPGQFVLCCATGKNTTPEAGLR